MASTVSNGNDRSEKWHRPFQMATTVYEREICLGDFQRAIEYHEKDLSIAKDVGDWAGEGQAYYNLSISYLNLDSLNESLAHFRLSVETHNTIRGSLISKDVWKIRYRTVWTNAYTCLWQVLIMLQKDERGPLRC